MCVHIQIERRLSSEPSPPVAADQRPSPPPPPSGAAALFGAQDSPPPAAAAAYSPTPSQSPALTAATGEAFFADAMRRAVAAQSWAIAKHLHALAQACGAITAVGPLVGGEGVASSPGPSRRLDLYMYGGALAGARAGGRAEEERGLVEVSGRKLGVGGDG